MTPASTGGREGAGRHGRRETARDRYGDRRSAPGGDARAPVRALCEVFKVVGKVFLLATEMPGEPVVTLKCEPEHSKALQQQYEELVPGYHMNKRHWLTIRVGDAVTRELVDGLVRNSYELVVEGLPRTKRPTGARQSHGEPSGA